MRQAAWLAGLLLLACPAAASAADNGLARTPPPMGWDSSGLAPCATTESGIQAGAASLAATGLRDAGYRLVIPGGCWQSERNIDHALEPDLARFPSGIAALAADVHRRGLQFGLATPTGTGGCRRGPGTGGHEAQDAQTFAAWGVDYVREDGCPPDPATPDPTPGAPYAAFAAALRATARPIVFAIDTDGAATPWAWAPAVSNLWRIDPARTACFDCDIRPRPGIQNAAAPLPGGVLQALDAAAGLARYAGPGAWNDPGLLQTGDPGLSPAEARTQFSIWAMLAAPLLIGTDAARLPPDAVATLTNAEVIAIDQDRDGRAADRLARDGDADVWARPLAGGARAVLLLNRGAQPRRIVVNWTDLGIADRPMVRDLWRRADLGHLKGGYAAIVPPHEAALLRVTPQVEPPGVSP